MAVVPESVTPAASIPSPTTTPTATLAPNPAKTPAADEQPTAPVYALWAVFTRPRAGVAADELATASADLDAALTEIAAAGVTTRGIYDVSGLKADTDLMFWLHGESPEVVQAALRTLRRVPAIAALEPHTNLVGTHREAEFNRQHIPAFVRGVPARQWLAVYPFVRSKDWYLIRDGERSRMLAEHGRAGAAYKGVLTNTVAAFALGDYEWIVPVESDDLAELVDMMRALRYVDARLHVIEETPFFTGRRITTADVAEVLG
ncbi:hydrogen peroxide-dependent heme synthase [Microbacterium sp.]|uniref:hydrogen peroxide-dependent heme synthase n=1 Tax=Microbacterium sp. TaxID=51671 RepID=UPI003A8F0397